MALEQHEHDPDELAVFHDWADRLRGDDEQWNRAVERARVSPIVSRALEFGVGDAFTAVETEAIARYAAAISTGVAVTDDAQFRAWIQAAGTPWTSIANRIGTILESADTAHAAQKVWADLNRMPEWSLLGDEWDDPQIGLGLMPLVTWAS
jgi:hypothetical protein